MEASKKAMAILGRGGDEGELKRATEALPKMDLADFHEQDFNPEKHARDILIRDEFHLILKSTRRREFLKHVHASLSAIHLQSIHELQRSVYAHCAEYIEVDKELARFSTDILSIRTILHDISAIAQGAIQQRAYIQRDHERTAATLSYMAAKTPKQ